MKIIHLCLSNYYIDGFSYQENELVSQHVTDGHEVTVFASTETFGESKDIVYVKPSDYMGSDGAWVSRLPYLWLFHPLISRKVRAYPGLMNKLVAAKPDVIFFHGASAWALLTAARYKRTNPSVKFFIDSHEDDTNSARTFVSRWVLHFLFYRPVLRHALKQAEVLLCVNVSAMDFMKRLYGISADRMEFYPLGGTLINRDVYLENRSRLRASLGISNEDVLFLQSGKFDRSKKLIESLKAFTSVSSPSARFLLAGHLHSDIMDEANGLIQGDRRIEFLGWQSPEELRKLLCAADVYVQPGTQSATMQMSLCCGCAVILDDVPSHHPYLNGNGWLVRDSSSLAKAMQDAVDAKTDLAAMAERSFEIARQMLDYRKLASRVYFPTDAKGAIQKTLLSDAANTRNEICTSCVMDSSDPLIKFDQYGVCDYCLNFRSLIAPSWNAEAGDPLALEALAARIKAAGRGKDFDCIIGLSGGLDSSYTAYVAKDLMGLRPLLFHVDAGWNTDQAVGNIEKLVDGLGLDLYTEVVNWPEMRDLQLAFLKSQIADQDLPQDIAFFSALYKFAHKHKVKYVLTGANFSTECCREPEEWGGYPGSDLRLVRDIHRRFGTIPLTSFPMMDILTYKVWYQQILGMKVVKPLNLVRYVKSEAEELLHRRFGWQKFQHKHHESRFTRFYEDYWMPRKFGYHKRRAHFSSLIMTGQMTREEALRRLERPEMDEHFLKQEFEYVATKLGLTVAELQAIFDGENKTYRDYRNKRWLIGLGADAMRWLGMEKRLFR